MAGVILSAHGQWALPQVHDEATKLLHARLDDEGAMRLRSRDHPTPNSDPLTRKRRHTDHNLEEGSNSNLKLFGASKPEEDPELWFPDGNILLEAGGVAFKVYGGLLATQSEVFRRLLSDARARRTELYLNTSADDCPTIRLADHPDDLRHLLRGVFLSSSLFNSANERMPFSVAAALVELGHKYRIQSIVNEGIRRITSCFSDKLDVWDAASQNMGSPLMSYASLDAIAVVNIARLTGIHSMLPVALYLCCQLDIDTILNGVLRADGTRVRLAPDDMALCLEQRASLRHDNIVSALRIWRPTPSEECGSRSKLGCVRVLEAVSGDWLDYDNGGLNHSAAMDGWDEFFEDGEFDLCEPCLEMVRKRAVEERQTMWERLPHLLNVSIAPEAATACIKSDG